MAKKLINVIYKVDDAELRKAKSTIASTEKETEKLNQELKRTSDLSKKAGQDGVKSFLDFKNISIAALAYSMGALAKKIFDVGVAQEQTNIAFKTFLGDAEKAKALLAELAKFAKETPFTSTQVNQAARTLLGFGFEAKEVIPTLKMLGDVSAGTGKDLGEMAVIFGQVRAAGQLYGQDLLQLINAGFNPLQTIAKTTGKSVAQLRKDMEKGLVTFDMVKQAFIDATSEGGLFFNLLENQSKTVGGRMAAIADNIEMIQKKLFEANQGGISETVGTVAELTSNVDALATVLDKWLSSVSIVPRKTLGFFAWIVEQAKEAAAETERARRTQLELQLLQAETYFKAPGGTWETQMEIFKEIVRLRNELGVKTPTTEDPLPWVNDDKNKNLKDTVGLIEELQQKIKKVDEDIKKTRDRGDLGANGRLIKLREQYQQQLDALMGKENKDQDKREKEALENTRKHLKQGYEDRKKKGDERLARERENEIASLKLAEYFYDLKKQKLKEQQEYEWEQAEAAADRRKRLEEDIFYASTTLAHALVDLAFQSKESDIKGIEEKYDKEIELARGNETKIKELQAQREQAVNAARERDRQANKRTARQKILAETAINITEAFPNYVLMALAAALGVVQLANVQRLRTGGWVKGPGTETSDSVPIMASRGEYMINADAAKGARQLLPLINEKKIDDRVLKSASSTGGFNDSRMVSELSAIRRDLNNLRGPDLVEQNGLLYKAYDNGRGYRRMVRAKSMSR